MRKIPFVVPDINEDDIREVVEVLRSGWITTGPVTKTFEKELAEFIGSPQGVTMSSQTMAAEMALRLLEIGEGDEVIVPAYTYSASCSIIYHVGATPVMIDSQSDTPEMDYERMAAAITERTKAIIPVDLGGIPCDYDAIFAAVESKKDLWNPTTRFQKLFDRVPVISDTAHALGARYYDTPCGSIGDFSNFSFHAVKNLTTGEGGYISWKSLGEDTDREIYRQLMLLSLHGQNKDALDKTKSGQWEYDIIEPYYKCNLTDIASALGLSQLRRYPAMLKRRHDIVSYYDEQFADLPLEIMRHDLPNRYSSAHLYIIRPNGFDVDDRNAFIKAMDERGIACNVHYKPLPLLSAYRKRGFDIADYPGAYEFYRNAVTLPLYSVLEDEQVERVAAAVREILR